MVRIIKISRNPTTGMAANRSQQFVCEHTQCEWLALCVRELLKNWSSRSANTRTVCPKCSWKVPHFWATASRAHDVIHILQFRYAAAGSFDQLCTKIHVSIRRKNVLRCKYRCRIRPNCRSDFVAAFFHRGQSNAALLLLCTHQPRICRSAEKKKKSWNESAKRIEASMHIFIWASNRSDRHEHCICSQTTDAHEKGNQNLNTFLRKVNIYLFFAHIHK